MRHGDRGLRMVRLSVKAVLILAIFSLVSSFAAADERILLFHSDITVHKDSSMTVKETIRVRSEGNKIKRGIFRDFPVTYHDEKGNRYVVGFEVVDVRREGNPEPYHIEGISNGKRVYIGDKDVFIPSAEHTYTLTYRTDRQLGFFKEFDELYWNVTGNGWDFPIDEASATIELPEGVSGNIMATDGYTGLQGSKEKAFAREVDPSGKITFTATRPLHEREGLTVALSWPKGLVKEPDTILRMKYAFSDNRAWIIGIVGLIFLCTYYLLVWAQFGKDPEEGVIVPRYAPPSNMSPAVMRFITQMGYDDRSFAAAVINMAVKGFLSIAEEDGKYTLRKKEGGSQPLSPEELKISTKLLGHAQEVTLEKANHATIRAAISEFKNHLKLKFEKIYFVTNRWYFGFGLLLTIVMLVLSGLWEASEKGRVPIFLFICFWLSIWSMGVIGLVSQVISRWRDVIRGRGNLFFSTGGAMFLTFFSIPFIGGEIAGLVVMGYSTSVTTIVFMVAAAFVNYLFYHLLKAPTLAGRRTLDEIEGFRTFLSATEKGRLNVLNPPDRTPELFEKYLPYALALDVEQQWAEQFAGIIAGAAAEETRRGYSPSWYSGRSFAAMSAGDFASSFGSSLAGAVSSSSTAPGSSSGSGGGGSSGGGGGGGGGGGW